MGKPILISSLAAAVALYGSSKAFIPGAGVTNANSSAALRGSVSGDAMESEVSRTATASSLTPMAMVTGTLAMAALGSSRKTRVSRRAAAAAVDANEVSEPPPPPPFNPAEQLGVTAPLGFFDPIGFSKVGDEEGFRKLRVAELKHGRVAMMAAVGAVIQCPLQFPGFENVPRGLGALTTTNGQIGLAEVVVLSGVLELLFWKDDSSKGVETIGDYGNPFQFGMGDPLGVSEDMKNRELNNGRAAMIAALGIIVAELATGKDACQQLGFSAAAPAAEAASAALGA